MVNYKPRNRTVTVGGYSFGIPNHADPVFIYLPVNNSGAPVSLYALSSLQAAFQVNTGRTFYAIGYIVNHTAVIAILRFYQGDTSGGIDTLKIKLTTPAFAGTSYYIYSGTPGTYTSEKYVTVDPTSTNINYVAVIGYQEAT